ncbi:TBC domain-containing protein [Spironucleus salmonicida]|uniref:TBC domain-containing protein n=1 Tax=Spironucleus salmonicida TaxID=348837 RepID=V6LWV3_9EUKA|nr:TBC domain-containing protein [Spironucleus salmonicida]|eukprot:EST48708.1 TBC domain-containing protein [Spironucleus salmonicida]
MDKIQPEQRIFIYKQVFSETSLPKKIIDDYMKASAKTQQEAKVFKTTIYPKKSVPYHEINFKNLDRLELPVDIYNRSLLYTTFLGAQTLQTARDLLYRVKLLPMNAEFNLVHDRDILETQFLASNYVQQHSMLLADIDRTFSSLWLFQAGQLLFHPLNNVVCAAILHNNFYVQGLSLLTAVLLLSADTEEQALALVLHYCGSRVFRDFQSFAEQTIKTYSICIFKAVIRLFEDQGEPLHVIQERLSQSVYHLVDCALSGLIFTGFAKKGIKFSLRILDVVMASTNLDQTLLEVLIAYAYESSCEILENGDEGVVQMMKQGGGDPARIIQTAKRIKGKFTAEINNLFVLLEMV